MWCGRVSFLHPTSKQDNGPNSPCNPGCPLRSGRATFCYSLPPETFAVPLATLFSPTVLHCLNWRVAPNVTIRMTCRPP